VVILIAPELQAEIIYNADVHLFQGYSPNIVAET
jgi:hypothetical protein